MARPAASPQQPKSGDKDPINPLRVLADLSGLVAVLITLWNTSQLALGRSTEDWGIQINEFLESLGGFVADLGTALLGIVPPVASLPWISVLLPVVLSVVFLLLSLLFGRRRFR